VRSIVVACPPGHAAELEGPGIEVIDGGDTRSASVANALQAVDTELVAIHDAARPLLSAELVEAVVAALLAEPAADGAIAAAPVTDTIKQVSAGRGSSPPASGGDGGALAIEKTIDRRRLWAAQTPQAFRTEALRRALLADPKGPEAATDEAMVVEAAGGLVLVHPSPPQNLKVTTPLDLRLAELALAAKGS
jgi:2-C-methyl-D-erythritol 4-phosphate cytidylyltransferase